jgi:glycosyltransferase involved in cell wall biosynthesis
VRSRPEIAFFDYHDVFEDFYPHYGVDQHSFATRWADTGSHALLASLQREVGNVVWYTFSIAPEIVEARHETIGCRIRMLPAPWLHRRLWRSFYLPRHAWRWRGAYPAYAWIASYASLFSAPLYREIRRQAPDFIVSQDYASGRFDVLAMLARAIDSRLVAYHAGSSPEHYIGRLAKRWTIPSAYRLITSSHREKEMLSHRFGVPEERLRVILTPIDLEVFRPTDRRASCDRAGLDASRRYLLFVGRLEDGVKRVSRIIRALGTLTASHHDVDLLIVGNGNDADELRLQADRQTPGRTRFFGWISDKRLLASVYNAAECLVLPSRSEGFPTVVGEAMGCGTPVLASDAGGIPELVREGRTGWLLDGDADESLAEKLDEVLRDPDRLRKMRLNARAAAESRVGSPGVDEELRECFLGARHLG